VLIVDDDSLSVKLTSNLVSSFNYEPVCLYNSQEFESKVLDGEYMAIITDFEMPNISGLDIIKKVADLNLDIPVILVTGFGNLNILKDAWSYGAFDFITKPINPRYLSEVLLLASQFGKEKISRPSFIKEKNTEEFFKPKGDLINDEIISNFLQVVGQDTYVEIVNDFFKDLNSTLDIIQSVDEVGFGNAARPIFHQLRGASANTGLAALEREFKRAEEMDGGPNAALFFKKILVLIEETKNLLRTKYNLHIP